MPPVGSVQLPFEDDGSAASCGTQANNQVAEHAKSVMLFASIESKAHAQSNGGTYLTLRKRGVLFRLSRLVVLRQDNQGARKHFIQRLQRLEQRRFCESRCGCLQERAK